MMTTRKHNDFTTPKEQRPEYRKPGAPGHTIRDPCPGYARWCRIHRHPDWSTGELHHDYYPITRYVPAGYYMRSDDTEGIRWETVVVHCGPGAFYPPRGKRGK